MLKIYLQPFFDPLFKSKVHKLEVQQSVEQTVTSFPYLMTKITVL
jgi:hypothetical protein